MPYIRTSARKALSISLLILVSTVRVADGAPDIEPGTSVLAIHEKDSEHVSGFIFLDLSTQIFHLRPTSRPHKFRFNILHVKEDEICVQFKASNPNVTAGPSCFERIASNHYSASGFVFDQYPEEYEFVDATLINKNNYDTLLRGTSWSLSSVDDCEKDSFNFHEDYSVSSHFETEDGPYGYTSTIKFLEDGLIEESGRDSEGKSVDSRFRLFLASGLERLYFQEVAFRDIDEGRWHPGTEGFSFSRCD